MRELRSEIAIDAPVERVWEVLTDFSSYPAWNPFITSIDGEAREGARLTARLEPPGSRAMTFKPTVRAAEAPREFRWLGRLLVPGLFDGEHIFELRATDAGGTRFVQREEFRGLLVGLLLRMVGQNTQRGFDDMNAALKARAEAAAS
ncbi:MAG: SRPBCC domain-containing protein [Chloroflexi bacterium]|nr:SRPBCC domain-containing protein [Chloroflexota bacterium]